MPTPAKLFDPVRLGPVTLKNRTIRAAAFEGMCPGHRPSEALIAYHRAVAAGGVGMTTVAYAAVEQSGLSFPHQLWLRPEIVGELRGLTDVIHQEGAKASIQIGHCGNMAKSRIAGSRPLAPSARFNLYGPVWPRAMDKNDINSVVASFGQAVALARDAGFDAVEVHAGHGYLISQFLSPFTNHRTDAYGGSLDNRMRFMREVMARVRDAARDDIAVLVKMNLRDGFPGGCDIDDALVIARALEQEGADALILSGGFVSRAPMVVMHGGMPTKVMAGLMDDWMLRIGVSLFGQWLIRPVPYEPCYFLEDAVKVRKEVRLPLVYIGGADSRAAIDRALAHGFDAVAMARALIRDPSFVRHLEEAESPDLPPTHPCDHCNYCAARIYNTSMACHLVDPPPKKLARHLPQAKQEPVQPRRAALVTGACSGIGLEIARELASRGHQLVLVSHRPDALEMAAKDLRSRYGVNVHTIALDLATPQAADELYEAVAAKRLEIDLLVNNAGMFFFGEVADADPARANALLQLHVVTPSLLCTRFARDMRERRSGHIMIVSSISAWRDFPGIGYYGASKKYLRGFANALRSELGPYGVKVTCLAPGATRTALYQSTTVPVELATKLGVMMDASAVAKVGVDAMFRGDAETTPGILSRTLRTAAALTPQPVVDLIRRYSPWLPAR